MGPGATLDKRRPDLRDELGYIAPPNRKLPPVPGSNYNTCDRIKRGTVISKHLNFPKQRLLIPTGSFSFFIEFHRFDLIHFRLHSLFCCQEKPKTKCKQARIIYLYKYTYKNENTIHTILYM